MHAIPSQDRARGLQLREEELRRRLQRCRDAAAIGGRPNPSLGRQTDDVPGAPARGPRQLALIHKRWYPPIRWVPAMPCGELTDGPASYRRGAAFARPG